MAFKDLADLDEFVGGKSLKHLPINGELVTFPDRISAKTGTLLIHLQRQDQDKAKVSLKGITNDQWLAIQEDLVGDEAMEKLISLGVVGDTYAHVVATLIVWHLQGQDAAEKVWNTPGKVMARPAKTRKKKRKTSKR